MSFWDLSTGEAATETGTSFEVTTGNEPIPDKSSVLAAIDEIKWGKNQNGDEYVSVRWAVMKPEEVENRKVFQKMWVTDLEPNTVSRDGEDKAIKKRDKARKMLAAIDANAGGKLARKPGKPTDDDMALALIGKPMVIKLGVWDIGGNSGNWVMAVSPKNSELVIGTSQPRRPAAQRDERSPAGGRTGGLSTDFDDEIPFAAEWR